MKIFIKIKIKFLLHSIFMHHKKRSRLHIRNNLPNFAYSYTYI